VAALSGPVDPGRLAAGLEALRSLGFEPVPASNLASRHREMLAGDDAERLAAFHALAADPSLAAIFFARGGWGLPRLLPQLDWDLLARHPRAYVGYSDLTPLLLGLVQRCGLIAFHGPMVAADFARGLDGDELSSLLGALGEEPELSYPLEGCLAAGLEGEPIEAPLLGGCLSLLAATAGTPYAPDLSGSLLFLEDVAEPPYRLDRMLTQLRQAGQLAGIRAMIVGHLTALGGRRPPAPAAEGGALGPLLDVFGEHAAALGVPFAWGLAAGHDAPNLTLPLGALARLDPAALRLSCRFAATVDGPPRGVAQ
jgi:muramoyltetrapeptide carboxypeptidase